jgi:hypothetical protein
MQQELKAIGEILVGKQPLNQPGLWSIVAIATCTVSRQVLPCERFAFCRHISRIEE